MEQRSRKARDDRPAGGKSYLGYRATPHIAAAARGEIPTIRIGHLLKVPVVQFNRLLNGTKYTVPPRSPAQTSQLGAVDDTTDLA